MKRTKLIIGVMALIAHICVSAEPGKLQLKVAYISAAHQKTELNLGPAKCSKNDKLVELSTDAGVLYLSKVCEQSKGGEMVRLAVVDTDTSSKYVPRITPVRISTEVVSPIAVVVLAEVNGIETSLLLSNY